MSEANAPFNPQAQSQAAAADSGWQAEPADLKGDGPLPEHNPETALDDCALADFDISKIFDASELEDLTFEAPQVANRSSIAAWLQEPQLLQPELPQPEFPQADRVEAGDELPNLADLVSLIQELNQCNDLLMTRVSQLEEALERSQTALQDEVGRTQQGSDSEQDWATVQEQVTNLFNQLEFAHQTNQRQQILIETLTGQLENSQERVAELEREAASIQQRYNEQTQLLAKSEHTGRDLQSRLQRQQRYTLQFKAALEKSLEVPTPQYEVGLSLEPVAAEAPLTAALFLPRAKRIQPWSAQTHSSKVQPLSKSPWMKFQNQSAAVGAVGELAASAQPAAQPLPEPLEPSEPLASVNALNLPSFGLPLPQLPLEPPVGSTEPPIAPDLDLAAPDPALKHQLNEAVKPLADLLAEALLSEAQSQTQQAKRELPIQPPSSESSSSSIPTDETTADALLASVMADAEDALWQDLARLIDVSAEDVVKASLSGDLAAFETLDFTELQATNEPQTAAQAAPSASAQPPVQPSAQPANAVTIAPLLRRLSQTAAHLEEAKSASSELNDPEGSNLSEGSNLTAASWPSPVVYPLRPVKKRHSLAMVDLPSFPKA